MSDKDDLTDASNYSGWEDEVCQSAKCLFCPEEIEVGQEYGKHLIAEHSFDLKTIISERKLDVHQVISLINYTRSIEIEKGAGYIDPERLKDNLYHSEDFKSSILSSGKYLKPVLKEDHVLYTVDEFIDLNSDCEEVNPTVTEGQPILRERESNTDLKLELSKIKIELRKCREFVKNLISGPADCADNRVTAPGNDESYFRLYEDLSIHDTMLKDKVRTGAYGKFVEGASNIFQGKTVLDVGCGTSILSLFCARSGSKRVYSVDNARLMMNVARQIVRDNCYENVIV